MLNKLSKNQEELKIKIKEEWINYCLSGNSELNYEDAELGIKFIYDKIKKPKPLIMVADSPIAGIAIAKLFGSKEKNTSYFGCGYDSGWVSFYDYFTRIGVLQNEDFNKLNIFVKSGAWDTLFFEKLCILIRRPISVIKNEKGQLHNPHGKSVEFRDKWGIYCLNGVRMKEDHVMLPAEKIDVQEIIKEQNTEVRRELIRKIGIERFILKTDSKVLDKHGDYELISIKLSEEVPDARYLKMLNPSIGVWHVEGVEGDTIEEAINFRAGRIISKSENWQPSLLT